MTTSVSAKPRAKGRPWLVWHSWLAMPVWGYMFFICLTGTLAVVGYEILWLIDPGMRVEADAPRHPVSAQVAAAEAAVPGGRAVSVATIEPYLPVIITVGHPDGAMVKAWVDPVGTPAGPVVTGLSQGPTLPDVLRALHGWLMVPWTNGLPWGWYAVSLAALPMAGSLITGILAYKRFWRAFTTRPSVRFGRGARTWLGDLHRLGGAWSLWFVALMAITGLWFLVMAVLQDYVMPSAFGMGGVRTPPDSLPVMAPGQAPPRPDLDARLAEALAAYPGTGFHYIRLPVTAYDPLVMFGSGRVPLLNDVMAFNPHTGERLLRRAAEEQKALMIAKQIFGRLHFGNFGGLAVKLIWFLFGLVLTGLVLSGTLIWSKRTLKAATKPAAAPLPVPAE